MQHLKAINNKRRINCVKKCWKLEDMNIVLALHEANKKKIDQEQTYSVPKEEAKGLKGCPSVQKKCLEAEKKANAPKKLKETYEVILKLEDENQNVQDQLKWKNKQFKYIEESHNKLCEQFKLSKKECGWISFHCSMKFVNCRRIWILKPKFQMIFKTSCRGATKPWLREKVGESIWRFKFLNSKHAFRTPFLIVMMPNRN